MAGPLADSIAPLRRQMARYYEALRAGRFEQYEPAARVRGVVWEAMDRFHDAHPDSSSWALKARLHELIAEHFEPVIFPDSPFYYEMGLRAAENWGTPHSGHVSAWLCRKRLGLVYAHPAWANIRHFGFADGPLGIAREYVFDADHHCPGYTRLLDTGVSGLLAEVDRRLAVCRDDGQADFLRAVRRSCRAVLRVAERFAERAEQMLGPRAGQSARFLAMIAQTARRVPAEPPRTFYEGLAALWFCREVTATLEGIGISVVGHLDRQLIGLYRADRAAGRLTERDARDLLARWMLPTDVKFHVDDSAWPETSTCMNLGGCDADGRCVYNELTRLILEVHDELGLLNPKPNCRFSAEAPREYLDLLGRYVLKGRNVFALLNDDVLIPACVRSGKSLREARLYVNGGCQETIVEGVEHSAGAYYYFNMPRVLDLCLLAAPAVPQDVHSPEAHALVPRPIEAAGDFEDFYRQFMAALLRTIEAGAAWRRAAAAAWPEIHPCPFFSASLDGCIESGRDYTAGGARHNASGVALVGLATLVDSLHAIRKGVFGERWLSLADLRAVRHRNWEGEEALRARFVGLGKFGHGDEEVDGLAGRLADELAAFIFALPNERGGHFQGSFFVYYQFAHMAPCVRATPDGRRAGELLSQGAAPGRLRAPKSLTDTFASLSRLDLRNFPANAVLDVQLPLGGATTPATLSAVLRTFAQMGGATLQPNVVSVEQLRDARVHPERHRDLIVRISGLSAHFVSLRPAVQAEIIDRHCVAAG